MVLHSVLSLAFVALGGATLVSAEDKICISENNHFTSVVDLYASELGYYTFKECPGQINPTIGIEIGERYFFTQRDRSNWFHPLGFAYFPDGAFNDLDELEPTVTQTGSSCVENNSCPTPRYFRGGEFLGEWGTEDFGLDVYEPEFFNNPAEWVSAGNYFIELIFNDEDYDKDIFYFCHIHQFMSGRIKLLRNGRPVQPNDDPPLGYEYDVPGEFDETCGSFGLDDFQLPNPVCPDTFVCAADVADQELADFSACIDAMNCHMLAGMTTGVKASSKTALFVHQMIPHHQNAVNMAKLLLRDMDAVNCPDLSDEDDQNCILEVILREIINGQNHQIQKMRRYLDFFSLPQTDNCVVEIDTLGVTTTRHEYPITTESGDEEDDNDSKSSETTYSVVNKAQSGVARGTSSPLSLSTVAAACVAVAGVL